MLDDFSDELVGSRLIYHDTLGSTSYSFDFELNQPDQRVFEDRAAVKVGK